MDDSKGSSTVGSILAMKSVAAKQVREESRQLRRRKLEQQKMVKSKTALHREARKQKQCGLQDVMRQTLSNAPLGASSFRQRPHTTHRSRTIGSEEDSPPAREHTRRARLKAGVGADASLSLDHLNMPVLNVNDQLRPRPISPLCARPASAMSSLPDLHRTRSRSPAKSSKQSAQLRLDTITKELEHRLKTEKFPAKPKSTASRSVRGAAFGLPPATEGPEFSPMAQSLKEACEDSFSLNEDDQVKGVMNEIKAIEAQDSRLWTPQLTQASQQSRNSKSSRRRKMNSSSLIHRQNVQRVGHLRSQFQTSYQNPDITEESYEQLASELYLRHATGEDKVLRPDGSRRSTPSLHELQEAYNIAKLRDPDVFKRGAHEPGQWRHNAKLPHEDMHKNENKTFLTTLQLGINSSA